MATKKKTAAKLKQVPAKALKRARPPAIRAFLDDEDDGLDEDEIVVDNFAGGGGASSGVERAIGRSPDIAVNHDEDAIAMHAANHPSCTHYRENVWQIDPVAACQGRPVGLAWFSPDCKHFSKAKGSTPKSQKVRGLAWSAVRWAQAVRPRIICLENVEEFKDWGPLDRKTGLADKARAGQTFRAFVRKLEKLGYKVEWKILKASDYGAPTSRRRFFLVARCDGRPIHWPEATHGPGRAHPHRTAGECMDWSVACPSIFDRSKQHAEKTLARIARGIRKFVLTDKPYIVPQGDTLVASYLVHRSNGERPVKVDEDGTVHAAQAPRVYDINEPLGTIMAQGQKHALVTAMLIKHNGGNNDAAGSSGQSLDKPCDSITSRDSKSLATVTLAKLDSDELRQRAKQVRAFLVRYNGKGEPEALDKPLGTLTTRDRYGLVTVEIDGETYAIVDIGMRMLTAPELFACQGFDPSYDITATAVRGAPLTKTAQVKLVGNSVAPPIATAIVRAQFRTAHVEKAAPRPAARPAQVEAHPVQPARPSKPAPAQPTLPGFTIVTPPRSYYVAGPTRTGKVIFDGARGSK
jgi:DNA (cytosine-5)-methyltransferase 1